MQHLILQKRKPDILMSAYICYYLIEVTIHSRYSVTVSGRYMGCNRDNIQRCRVKGENRYGQTCIKDRFIKRGSGRL